KALLPATNSCRRRSSPADDGPAANRTARKRIVMRVRRPIVNHRMLVQEMMAAGATGLPVWNGQIVRIIAGTVGIFPRRQTNVSGGTEPQTSRSQAVPPLLRLQQLDA